MVVEREKAKRQSVPVEKKQEQRTVFETSPAEKVVEKREVLVDNVALPERKPLFRREAEQLVALALPSSPGAEVPPLPEIGPEEERDWEESFAEDLFVEEGDTEDDIARKEDVAALKEQWAAAKREGWTFERYLQELRNQANEDAQVLALARRKAAQLCRDASLPEGERNRQLRELEDLLAERGLSLQRTSSTR